jgi:transporter family-2 protein
MNLAYYVLAILAGVFVPIQAGINSLLAKQLKHPAWASLASFVIGACALAIVAFTIARPAPPITRATAAASWWVWTGGLLGAAFVTFALIAAPRVGALGLLAASLAGQMLASLILDHFGLLGFPTHPISPGRVCGVLLIAGGVALVRYF